MPVAAQRSGSRQHCLRRSGGGAAVITAAVSAALLTIQPAAGQVPIFSDYVVLGRDDSRVRGGEPSLQISIRGNLWSTDVGSPPVVWKSVDRGATWTPFPLPISIGGADRDAAEDDEGRLHVVDQTDARNDCIFYYRSLDGGQTFDIVRGTYGNGVWFDGQGDCMTRRGGAVDRPWVATWGRDTVYIVYRESGFNGVDVSLDGGATFFHISTSAPIYAATGMAVDPADGTLHLFYQYPVRFDPALGRAVAPILGAATSLDRGKTFLSSVVVNRGNRDVMAGGFAAGAVDRAGNVYVVWGDDSNDSVQIYLSVSTDRGRTWNRPWQVSRNLRVSIYPTIVAGEAGRIAVAWYGTPDPATSRTEAAGASWYVYAAVSTNALNEEPIFKQVKVHPEPFHRNSICAHVNICEGVDTTTGKRPPGYESGIVDFFKMALDPEGRLNVIWTDTAHYQDSPKNHFARESVANPVLSLDAPANGATVGPSFNVSGWAIDTGALSGTGMDAVHVYVYPSGSTTPVFVQAATYGSARPDIGSLFGSQFTNSGFSVTVSGLASGSYQVTAFGHSTVTNTFAVARTVNITVSAPQSRPVMSLDGPQSNSTVGRTVTVAGWAVDLAAASGTGVDTIHVYAFPASGAAVFLGSATYGIARPDIGAALGSQFRNSGYQLSAVVEPAGVYTIAAYARSTVAGTFNAGVAATNVTVQSSNTNAVLFVDTPGQNASPTRPFTVSGWAVDSGSTSGTGIDAIHVWAFPTSGAAATFVGVAPYGTSRPDIGSLFGDARFNNSGFTFTVNSSNLAAGSYDVIVFGRSTVTNGFTVARVVRLNVQ